MIQIGFEWDKLSRSYEVISFHQSDTTSIRIKDQALEEKLSSHNCEASLTGQGKLLCHCLEKNQKVIL